MGFQFVCHCKTWSGYSWWLARKWLDTTRSPSQSNLHTCVCCTQFQTWWALHHSHLDPKLPHHSLACIASAWSCFLLRRKLNIGSKAHFPKLCVIFGYLLLVTKKLFIIGHLPGCSFSRAKKESCNFQAFWQTMHFWHYNARKCLFCQVLFPSICTLYLLTVCVCLLTLSSTKVHSRSSNLAVFCTLSTDFIGLKMPQVRPGMKRVLVAIVVMQHRENEARKTVIWKQAAMSQDMRRWSDGKPQWCFTSYRAFATEIIFPSQNEEGKTHLALSVGKQLNVPSTWQQFRKTMVYKKLLENHRST